MYDDINDEIQNHIVVCPPEMQVKTAVCEYMKNPTIMWNIYISTIIHNLTGFSITKKICMLKIMNMKLAKKFVTN